MIYEVRFYDAQEHVKVSVELTAADSRVAVDAAKLYLGDEAPMRLLDHRLSHAGVRELPS